MAYKEIADSTGVGNKSIDKWYKFGHPISFANQLENIVLWSQILKRISLYLCFQTSKPFTAYHRRNFERIIRFGVKMFDLCNSSTIQ